MFQYLFGLTLLKSINPYFRKHILNTLDAHDFLFINTVFITILVIFILLYKISFDKSFKIKDSIKNIKRLSHSQYGCIIILSVLTVTSSLFLYELDKNYNTPLLNFIFLRLGGILAIFLVGIFIFEERYTWSQIIGIFVTLIGVYLISGNKDKD